MRPCWIRPTCRARNSALRAIGRYSQCHAWSLAVIAYRGFVSFAYAVIATLILSRLEPPPDRARLVNLTVHTLEDVRGPWVGLKAWPGLWKWALGLSIGWFGFTAAWEWYGRTH